MVNALDEMVYLTETNRCSSMTKHLVTGFILICLITFSIFDAIYSKFFLIDSGQLTERIQKNLDGTKEFIKITSLIFSTVFSYWVGPYLIFHFHFSQYKPRTFALMMYYSSSIYVGGFLKISYLDSRPFLAWLGCEAWSCQCDFGKPSGHSVIGVTNTVIILEEVYHHLIWDGKKRPIPWWYWVLVVLCVLQFDFIAISRVILGVHSYNQVILGSLWGFFLAALYIFYWKKGVEELFAKVKTQKSRRKCIMILLAIVLGLTLWSIVQMALTLYLFTPDPEIVKYWYKCPECHETFSMGTMKIFAIASFPFSMILAYYMYCVDLSNVKYLNEGIYVVKPQRHLQEQELAQLRV